MRNGLSDPSMEVDTIKRLMELGVPVPKIRQIAVLNQYVFERSEMVKLNQDLDTGADPNEELKSSSSSSS